MGAVNFGGNDANILINNRDDTFQGVFPPSAVGKNPTDIVSDDLNLDDIPDLVVSNQGSNDISFLFGNGDGTFQIQQTLVTLPEPTSVVIADFNNDGLNDVAVVDGRDFILDFNRASILLFTP